MGPRETLRVVLLGGGVGLWVVSLAWTAVVGVWLASPATPTERIQRLLELQTLGFHAGVTAVVLGYLGLVVGIGLTAIGATIPVQSPRSLVPDLGVAATTRSRVVLDVSLSVLVAVGAVGVLAVLFSSDAVVSDPFTVRPDMFLPAFLLRLVLLVECCVLLVRLWRPLQHHSDRLVGLEHSYERVHRRLESVPDRWPVATYWLRNAAIAGSLLGVPAIGVFTFALGYGPAVVLLVLAAAAAFGLPVCAAAGVFPTLDTPVEDRVLRGQRTLVIGGAVAAVPGTVVSAAAFMAATGSSALLFAVVGPAPVTPIDTIVVGWTMLLVGYAWRLRDRLVAAVGDRTGSGGDQKPAQ